MFANARATGVVSRPSERGNVLLLSLFMLSSILIASAAVSAIVIHDIRSGRVIDEGHAAYYAAETGIEQALYNLRRAGQTAAAQNGGESMANSAAYVRQVQTGEPVFYAQPLKDGDTVELNLFDADNLAASSGIESISLDWQDACGGCTTLDLSYAQWPVGANIDWPPGGSLSQTYWKYRHKLSDGVPWVKDDTISASNHYRARLGAIGGAITNLTVRAFDGSGQPVDIPSRVSLRSTGTYGRAQQTLSAFVERSAPLSGIFNYVIFSEETVTK